jgi:hypothetical protein
MQPTRREVASPQFRGCMLFNGCQVNGLDTVK